MKLIPGQVRRVGISVDNTNDYGGEAVLATVHHGREGTLEEAAMLDGANRI